MPIHKNSISENDSNAHSAAQDSLEINNVQKNVTKDIRNKGIYIRILHDKLLTIL
jgi:hypothetical protein